MGGLKPIGSEKLEGMDKLRRIMEIARYKENIPQNVNETKSTEYSIDFADGNTYIIEKERQGYIIKMSINESDSDYIEPMKGRKYYPSYSQALRRLNLMAREINVLHENEEGISLIGEQKKKFILKTKKKKAAAADAEPTPPPPAIPPAPATPPPPPADLGVPPPPDMGGDMGVPPPPDMGGDMGADLGAPPPDMGGDMGTPPPDDMGGDMGGDMPPAEGDMGGDMPPMGDEEVETEIDVEEKPKEKKVSDLKRIQILVGKLSQKIRSYEEEKELSNKEIKYIINSILSAINVDALDEDDIEQIIDKLEGTDEDEEGSDEEEVSFEEENTDVIPEPPAEPEMAEGFDNLGDAFNNLMGGALTAGMTKKLTHENENDFEEDFDDDDYHKDRRKGRKHYPNVDTFTHGTFAESSVDKVLSKYFIINEEEEKEYQLKKERKTSQTYKNNKENIVRLSESSEQLDTALDYIRENPRVKLMGLSTKGNLIFKEGINEVRVTKLGKLI
jgi:hypothetical protein